MTNLDIPDFLKLTPDDRRTAWIGRKLTKPKAEKFMARRTPEDAQTRAFRRELEKQERAKKAERLAALNEWKKAKRLGQVRR